MISDISICIIILISMIMGYRKGLIGTLVHTFGWIIALVGAWFSLPYASEFLRDRTEIYESILSRTTEVLSPSSESFMPEIITENINDLVSSIAEHISDAIYSVIVFIAAAILIRIVLLLLSKLFDGERDTAIGFVSGVSGMLLGLLRGVIIVVILTALLFPGMSLMSSDTSEKISSDLDDSRIAILLYENNPIVEYIAEKDKTKDEESPS